MAYKPFSLFHDQEDDPNFSNRVANGEFLETSDGNFRSIEAETFPLAALADANSKGSGAPESNVDGIWAIGGGTEDGDVDRFRNALSSPRRDD